MYRVEYSKVAVREDGTLGEMPHDSGTMYTDCPFSDIERVLIERFAADKQHPVIREVKRIEGFVIKSR